MARPSKRPEHSTPQPMIGLRVPPELKETLEEAARAADRTLAAECERRLRRSFNSDELMQDAITVADAGGHDPWKNLEDYGDRTHELARRVMTLLYGADVAETAALLATSIAVLRSMEHVKADAKVRKVILAACAEHLDRIKATIRELERECVITTEKE